jgi:hypothetical protein
VRSRGQRASEAPDPAYHQAPRGVPASDFFSENCSICREVRAIRLYGMASAKQNAPTINIALRGPLDASNKTRTFSCIVTRHRVNWLYWKWCGRRIAAFETLVRMIPFWHADAAFAHDSRQIRSNLRAQRPLEFRCFVAPPRNF